MKTTILIAFAVVLGLVACTNAKKHSHGAPSSPNSSVGKVTYLADSEFRRLVMDYVAHPQEWVYKSKRPAVIDFYATWCGPCKMMSPIVEAMAGAYAGKIDFYKVDIDQEKQLAAMFGIQSIPTFLFIPVNGNPTLLTGAMQKDEFEKVISDVLLE